MIRHIVVLCAVLLVNGAISFAQKIDVLSCTIHKTDSAFILAPRYDLNDNPCAIVKVFPRNITGKIEFYGNIVGDVINKDSLYIIYLSQKTKRLKVYHSDYYPKTIEFCEFEESRNGVQSKSVYHVIVNGKSPGSSPKNYPLGSRVLQFKSDKPIKQLMVNGKEWPISNNSSKCLLPYGEYNYEATDNYGKSVSGTIELLPSIGSHIIHLEF